MPKIIKNGREYSGTPLEEVTAWPPTGDSVQIEQPLMGSTDISAVGDGTVTGAIAQNVEDITDLNNRLIDLIVVTVTVGSTGSVGANATKSFTNVDISESIPSGYSPFFITPRYTGDDQFCWVQCVLTDDKKVNAMVRNCSSAADSGQPTIYAVCKKDN